MNFSSPVYVSASTTYVASCYAPNGHFAHDWNYFLNPRDFGAINTPANAGVFLQDSTGFPSSTFQNSNHYVEPIFMTEAEAVDIGITVDPR
jgi:Domain of unknown function (DUF4082)